MARPSRPAAALLRVVAAILLVALAGCGAPREAPLPAGTKVLVLGDSITAGYRVGPEAAWPAQLARRTGWQVIAAGVSGDRTAGGRARLPALLDAHAPALVIVELGGNDLLRGVPTREIVANLEAMIAAVRERGGKVVLMAAPQPSALGLVTGLAAAPLFRELAERAGVPLIANALPSVLSERELKLDTLHPTAAGHEVLARRAGDELAQLGLVAAR